MPVTKATTKEQMIHDFVHSDNPKFAGHSKEERIKQALAAWYGMHKESTDESVVKPVKAAIYGPKASAETKLFGAALKGVGAVAKKVKRLVADTEIPVLTFKQWINENIENENIMRAMSDYGNPMKITSPSKHSITGKSSIHINVGGDNEQLKLANARLKKMGLGDSHVAVHAAQKIGSFPNIGKND